MTALMVPLALDVLLVRKDALPFAPTKMAKPEPNPQQGRRQQLVPDPFGTDVAREQGAYLHWSLPDGLTHAQQPEGSTAPVFPAIPDRWLVFRLTGDASIAPRDVTAWLLPDVNAPTLQPIPDVLGSANPGPNPAVPTGKAFTVLGTGDLSWAGYFDNVVGQLSLYDPLTDVDGSLSYVVCGWYTRIGLDPINQVTDATFLDFLQSRGWKLPTGVSASGNRPPSIVTHGAALGMGWPEPTWPGDGGVLAVEAGGPPDSDGVDVVVADTIAEATAALSLDPEGTRAGPQTQRLVQATIAGMLSSLATANGPAALDTALHMSRFVSLASEVKSETIWESTDVPTATRSSAASPTALRRSAPGLVGALAASETLAGVAAQDETTGPDVGGALVSAERSDPRVFTPADPVLVLRGAGRSFVHGGDGRFDPEQLLVCRLSGDTVTSFRAPGQPPEDASTMLPSNIESQLTALGTPTDVLPLLKEAVSLDPSSATDLAAATDTTPSPDAAARAAWLDEPTVVPQQGVVGRLPSPVAAIGAVRPWTPMHAEWRLEWTPAIRGVHGFTLGSVDYELPTSDDLPEVAPPQQFDGRCLVTGSPAKIAGGGVAQVMSQLRTRDLLDNHPLASFVASAAAAFAAEGGRASVHGIEGAVEDQDLLSGSLENFLALLRGENTSPMVRPPTPDGSPQPTTTPADSKNPDVLRAGLARITRLRIVDAFGQYVDLLGSSATTPARSEDVVVGVSEAVEGTPGLIALVPRLNVKARAMMRYVAADGSNKDADTAVSPLCGFVLPSPIDGSLEFFDASGIALGRIRADERQGAAWEEDPGQPASFGRKPSSAIPNAFLGKFADGLLARDTALAVDHTGDRPQTALQALNQLIDTTRWTVDSTGTTGDEHLSLLLGHPVAVMRAALRIDVQGAPSNSNAGTTSIPVKLGTLAHTQDGLLAYFVDDDYTRAHVVDPAVGPVAPPGGSSITSDYIDLSPSFDVQPEQIMPLTVLVVPGTDIHVTTGLLPQKTIGMRRDWVSAPLASLTPNWRYGPVLLDPKVTRVPVASDVRGIWTWYSRPDPVSWAPAAIVNADATAILAEDKAVAQHGWIRLQLQPDPDFPGIPVQVQCIRKPPNTRILGVGGLNGDGTRWFMETEQAIQMIESGRFFFFVQDPRVPPPHGDDGRVRIITDVTDAGRKFIRTVEDADPVNNLLNLPQCPP
jgi:Protein of unknown function (DUF3892)